MEPQEVVRSAPACRPKQGRSALAHVSKPQCRTTYGPGLPRPFGPQSKVAAGSRRTHLPSWRFVIDFVPGASTAVHRYPLGPPRSLPVGWSGIFGKNTRSRSLAWPHVIPQACTVYRWPSRVGPSVSPCPGPATHLGPFVVQLVGFPFGNLGMFGGGGGNCAAAAPADPASSAIKHGTTEQTRRVERMARVSQHSCSHAKRERENSGRTVVGTH